MGSSKNTLKKVLVSLSIVLTVFISYSAQINPKNISTNNLVATEVVQAARHKGHVNRNSQTVYIATKSGKKYHFSPSCRGLRRAKGDIKKISLSHAIHLGYTRCKLG